MTLINKIKLKLSDRNVTVFIILAAITGRIIQLLYFFNIRLDASHQFIATQNFVNGHGITMATAYGSDISSTVYEPLINWPPGYSILLSPFYVLFKGNYVAAGLCLGILAAILLILVSRSILKLLDVPLYLININTLISGFIIYFFYFIASSDAVAISLGLLAIYYCLLLLKSNEGWIKKIIGITIPLLFCGVIKYLFIPTIFAIPFFLIWKGITNKNRILIKSGGYITVILVGILGALLLWQKSISGTAAYISQPGRGFFPDNLLSFFPFIPGSFLKPDTAAMLLRKDPATASSMLVVFQYIHFFFLAVLSVIFIKKILTTGIKKSTPAGNFLYLTFFTAAAICVLLTILSLMVEKERWDSGQLWTYIEDQRYYGLPIVMIQLSFFIFYHHYRSHLSRFYRYFLNFLFLLLLIEAARGMIFSAKRITLFQKEEYSWQSEYRFQQYADNIIQEALRKQPAASVVVGGPFRYFNHRVCLYSNAALLDNPEENLNNYQSLKVSKTTLLLVILEEKDFARYQTFLSAKKNEVAGQFDRLYFYTVYVTPN